MKAKKKLTRLCGILLILAMLVGLLPTAALAADPATKKADFISDPTAALALLNAAKTPGAEDSTWDPATKTLTLNGVNFVTTAATAVQLPDGAKITLADGTTNTIKGGDAATGDCYGIYGVGSLTIQGTGTLNVTSGTSTSNLSFGIHAQGSVTINSGAVTATGGAALNGQNGQSFGIRALNNALTITGGTVTATGSDAKISSNGLWAGDGSVTISGGTVVAESGRVTGVGASSGIYAKNVEINNTGTIVTATGGTAQHGTSYGINAVNSATVTFSGGTLTAATKGDSCIKGTFNAAGKTISFDSNDGVGNMMARTTAAEYTLPENGFTAPSGKQFKGWEVDGTEKAVGATITVTDGTTVKAVWENITYTVSFDANGGTGTMTAVSGVSRDYTLPENGFTAPAGKQFKCWSVNDTEKEVGDKITVTANTTVTAVWENIPVTTYTITFNANGGGGSMANVTGVSGEYTLPGNSFTAPEGKQFKCWSVNDTEKEVGDKITVTANTTVTAVWEDEPVTLSSIDITTPPTKTTYTEGESFDTAGMVVTATYSDGSTAAVTGYTVSPDRALTTGDTSVTITYTEGGVTKTVTRAITVNPAAPTGGVIIYTPPTYQVESAVSKDADGSVSFSQNSAKKGDAVTITVTPDRYYKVDGVTVKDASGKEIAVTDNGDGTFTFQMPDSKVTVEPVFSWDNPFVDVAGDAYYAPAVEWALKNEVTDGTSDTTFSPDAGCTRAQIVTFLWRAAGCPEPAGMSSFTDVSADAYYAKAVAWAAEQGITGGTGDGKFSPDAVCTRGQIVTFLWRAEKSPAVGTANPFTDVEADAYYAGATNWAVENGITEGTGDGTTFSPANDCTRAQIVTFLYRFFVK